MSWCPNCKYEYEREFTNCTDCGALLVEEVPLEEKFEFNIDDYVEDKAVFLVTPNDEIEANFIESILKEEKIPVLVEHPSLGFVLPSNVFFNSYSGNVEFFVPERLLPRAKEIVEDLRKEPEFIDMPEAEEEYNEDI